MINPKLELQLIGYIYRKRFFKVHKIAKVTVTIAKCLDVLKGSNI